MPKGQYARSKQGAKYTDKVINERAAAKGFTVTGITRDEAIPFVHMKCEKNHKRTVRANSIQSAVCQICNGNRYDLPKARTFVKSLGYQIKEEPEVDQDMYGNDYVKVNTRFLTTCPEGHDYRTNLLELSKKKQCTLCTGTASYAGYSRSEEIISRILNYNNIEHVRQQEIIIGEEKLYLDFYIPSLKTIIEFDGSHHKYGRSNNTQEEVDDIQRKDALRDHYAMLKGISMVRIPYTSDGKCLVYELANILPIGVINVDDPYYDIIVMDVMDEAAKRFGWLTYDETKKNAIAYLYNSIGDASSITGTHQPVIARHFRRIYGMNKTDYLKKLRGGEVG